MLQAAPQFSPFQLLDMGRRAEAEGNVDAAFQFYRRTVDQFAHTAEAAAAFDGLARIKANWQPKARHLNGGSHHVNGASNKGDLIPRHNEPERRVWRNKYPAPRNHYRTGKALANVVSVTGWLISAAGLAAMPTYFFLGSPIIAIGLLGVLGAAMMVAVFGLLTVALGQATRAVFDQANATRELVAIERAKGGWEGA
jgi:hypothetical protein